MGNSLVGLGVAVSLGVMLACLVVILMIARLRRTTRKNSELEELRGVNLAAMGYIFRLESAYQEVCLHFKTPPNWEALDKPEILQRSFLVKKAAEEGNREIAELASIVSQMQEVMRVHLPPPPQPPPTAPDQGIKA